MIDLTAITTPFGLLNAETQAALKAHGGDYQIVGDDGWEDNGGQPSFFPHMTYRVKPTPPKPRECWLHINHNGELRTCDEETEGATLWREVIA